MLQKKAEKKHNLNIIIVGLGKVGGTLVEQLSKEGNDITVIDKNPTAVQAMSSAYDVMGIIGNGASYSIQTEAGIENCDLFIAVTESDELNLLCCTVAKRVSNCSAIARVRTPDYSKETEYLQAIECLKTLGANIKTTEMFVFETLQTSKHPKFKEIQSLIK